MLKLDKYIFFKYFLFLGWILLWGSLSFNPEKLYTINNFELLNKGIYNIFDFLRGISTLIYCFILLFITFFSYKKIYLIKNKKSEYIFVFLLLIAIFFLQAIPYYYNGFPIQNLYFLTNSILSSLILFILFQYYEKKDLGIILYINFIFLCLICAYFGIQYLFTYLQTGSNFYATWGNIKDNFIDIPRPTGLSRSFLITFIILYFLKTKSKNILIFKRILEILCIFFILMLSSRTTSFLLLIFIITSFIFLKKNKKEILKDILYYIIFPIILIFLFLNLKILILEKINFQNSTLIDQLRIYPTSNTPAGKVTDFSSGRFNDWNEIIKKNENVIFGNGVMGDRILISQSASNGILYTYASSGLVGVFLLSLISFTIIFNAIKIFFLKTYKNENLVNISAILIIIIFLRSILENSYTLFGIDFLIFFSSYSILLKYRK